MKNYQKAEMIAKNLPTGSYAAGCPEHTHSMSNYCTRPNGGEIAYVGGCAACEVTR